jgi:hypothetical protein
MWLSISEGPTNQRFATWFTYDAAGMPTWYTLELGSWRVFWNNSTYSGSVYRYTGPYFATAFDANKHRGDAGWYRNIDVLGRLHGAS